ncbi:MAG TPA: MBL fold metallo-hydrolase [Burkholderiaceae bacterium]|nr:MBL fold metallo-hydrolase [Burkholderiaceae bacterium]
MPQSPKIHAYFDEPTNTVSYLVVDPTTRAAAVVDPVLDYDPASGEVSTRSARRILADARDAGLTLEWVLETHAHADHLSAAPFFRREAGARIVIGEHITEVQRIFSATFNLKDISCTGAEFDKLVRDGETFELGNMKVAVLHTPGHTPACVSYRIGDAVFVGDTLFMPDYGTARADFPGGDARTLYRSIQKLLALPPATRLFLCHDYKAPGRDEYAWETTVAEQRARNIHVHEGVAEDEFVTMRESRDATLAVPQLLLPSVQVNIRAGRMPAAEDNGISYLKIPLTMKDKV